jgi:hypothetical protein
MCIQKVMKPKKETMKSTYEKYCNKYSDSFDDGFTCAVKEFEKRDKDIICWLSEVKEWNAHDSVWIDKTINKLKEKQ